MLSRMFACLVFALALPLAAQSTPPDLHGQIYNITDGDGNAILDADGNPLTITSEFTISGIGGNYKGKSYVNGQLVEEICVTQVTDGAYIYKNEKKGTTGHFVWNEEGYFELYSSYNGGTRRRLYPTE